MSDKFVLKIDNKFNLLIDLTHHFGERYVGRVNDESIIMNAIDLMISNEIFKDSKMGFTYVVRDFKDNISIVFIMYRYSKEDMELYYDDVENFETTNFVVTLKTVYHSASEFQQYPYLMVFVIDNKGALVEDNPMQYSEYDTWSLCNNNKPQKRTWKWPKNWSMDYLTMLEKNTEFSSKIKEMLKKYPPPKNYSFK